jgi:hypothetical protein
MKDGKIMAGTAPAIWFPSPQRAVHFLLSTPVAVNGPFATSPPAHATLPARLM